MYFMLNKADDVFQDLEVLKAVPKLCSERPSIKAGVNL